MAPSLSGKERGRHMRFSDLVVAGLVTIAGVEFGFRRVSL
jgi:hypothetical protein